MKNKLFRILSVLLMITLDCRQLKAQVNNTVPTPTIPQVIPRDVQPPSTSPLPSPQQLTPPSDLLPPSSIPTPTPFEEFPTPITETFTVKRFEVSGSTVFNQLELAKVLEEFTNRLITLNELYQARSKITDLYISKGYITSGAYIPPQSIESGIVKIQIIEGKLTDINVKGTRRLDPNYIRSRIAAANDGPLNQQHLLNSLQLLKLNPLIKNLSADLQNGNSLNESILVVNVEEAKTFSAELTLDNARSPAVGSFQRRLQINEANLLGLGDGLSIGYSNTDGSNIVNASYTLPLNPQNGTLSFYYGIAENNVVEHPFNTLDIHSDNRYYELTFRQPLVQTPTQEFALGLTVSRQESEASYVPNKQRIAFPQSGSDNKGHTRISALRFFQDWTIRDNRQILALRSQFNLGIDAFDATVNQDAPDSRFFSWLGQAQWARLISSDSLLLLRMNAQLATRALVASEQFGLGGIESIRGYRQDLLLADNGAFASAEVRIPVLRASNADVLQVIPFVNFGFAWNNSSANKLDYNTLASIGMGMHWTGDHFTARLDYAIPLIDVDQPNQTWQENGFYFSLLYKLF